MRMALNTFGFFLRNFYLVEGVGVHLGERAQTGRAQTGKKKNLSAAA